MSSTIPLNSEPLMHVGTDHRIYMGETSIAFIDGAISDIQVVKAQRYLEAAHNAIEAMELFCIRVERNEIHSQVTYNSFMHILKKLGLR